MYIWERLGWPKWRWTSDRLAPALEAAHLKQGRFLARMERLGFPLRGEAELQAVTEEAVKNAEIEGERLDRESVRSSTARRLGLPDAGIAAEDRRVDGMIDMMLDATQNLNLAVTRERLCAWQAGLFPTGESGLSDITVGAWRTDQLGPMQVVSSPIVRPRVHYQAPPAERVESEMQTFLNWLNMPVDVDGILHAALAHLWLGEAERTSEAVLQKAEFWHFHALDAFNGRQRIVLNRFLDGFEGKLTAPKWAAMARCSLPTAQRDLKDLVDRAILVRNDGSKNTSYNLPFFDALSVRR